MVALAGRGSVQRGRRAQRQRGLRRGPVRRPGGGRRRRRRRPPGEGRRRPRDPKRRPMAGRRARRRGLERGVRLGPERVVDHREARLAAADRAGRVGPRRQGAHPARLDHLPALAPVRDRPGRCLLDRLLVTPREPVAARPPLRHRPGEGLGRLPARRARTHRARRRPRGRVHRARHRPQPGDRARPRPAPPRRGGRARRRGHGLRGA